MEFVVKMFKKYKEAILYIFFGGIAFFLNLFLFWLFHGVLGLGVTLTNALSWFICVLQQYITNKLWVFESKTEGFGAFFKEITSFFGGRVFTGVLEIVSMFVTCDLLHFNEYVFKILTQVVVIILNFVISKLIVFKKK